MDPAEYRRQLWLLAGFTIPVSECRFTIDELEQLILAGPVDLPIVRLPDHYHRGKKWFTNLGDVDMCNCGAKWPCPDPSVEVL
jgi:hypothetical protein